MNVLNSYIKVSKTNTRMKKKMMMALMASMVLSTVLGAAGTAKADEDLYGFEEPVTIKIGYSWGKDFPGKEGQDSSNN